MKPDYLLDIINEHINASGNLVLMLRQQFQQHDLLSAWRQGIIPQSGQLASGHTFIFHGVGCIFESNGLEIDVDFGPDGRCDGFDAWRIANFARQTSYSHDFNIESIKSGLEQLQKSGRVISPKWSPSSHLLYLADRSTEGV